jgi:hypothetical protein
MIVEAGIAPMDEGITVLKSSDLEYRNFFKYVSCDFICISANRMA